MLGKINVYVYEFKVYVSNNVCYVVAKELQLNLRNVENSLSIYKIVPLVREYVGRLTN